jgi:hypothetical protein
MTGASIDGCPVLKPLLLSPASAVAAPKAVIAMARAALARIERRLISPPDVAVCQV